MPSTIYDSSVYDESMSISEHNQQREIVLEAVRETKQIGTYEASELARREAQEREEIGIKLGIAYTKLPKRAQRTRQDKH